MKWPKTLVPFDAALDDQTPGQAKIQRNEYVAEGLLPVVDQGQRLIGGYCDDETRKYGGPLPVIVFGDHTLAFKFVDFPFVLGADGVRVLTATPPFEPRFLFYYLLSANIPSRGYARHFKFLRELEFPLIAKSEQRRIVNLLEQADALRRQRAEADALTERIIPALFRKTFGDPATNPKQFPTCRLRDLAAKFSDGPFGSNLKSDHYVERGVRVVRLQNIGVGKFLDNDKAYISEEHFAQLSKHACSPGDVLIGTLGDPNLRACIHPTWLSIALNKADCVQARARPDLSTPEYLCWLLNSPSTLAMAGGLIVGQTRSRISMGRLAELVVPQPPVDLQRQFSANLKSFDSAMNNAEAAAHNIERLFQTMLHRAFTGELTARWREAHMEELLAEMEQQKWHLSATSKAAS